MTYDVDADIYEGPLPLLVELAKLNLVDLFIVKLVHLTGQYLAQVKTAGADLNALAEPLPLLGQLVALKARGLLPSPESAAEEDDVPISLEELERRLKEYQQFKTVAQLLSELHALAHQRFAREGAHGVDALSGAQAPDGDAAPAGEAQAFDVGIADLVGAFSRVLEKATAPVYEVAVEPWTVEMKVEELRVALTVRRQMRFFDLFTSDKTKLELVVTFLALLELIRQRVIRAVQERVFADIQLVWTGQPSPPMPGASQASMQGEAPAEDRKEPPS
ncbi:MAG TPA: segregation/condensation protein A [bacterium]